MNVQSSHNNLLETLKDINNGAVTIRLYPPNSYQVTKSIERAYNQFKNYADRYGDFSAALTKAGPVLGNRLLSDDELDSFTLLIVYRQLHLINRPLLIIPDNADIDTFVNILEVLAATPDRITQEGGVKKFLRRVRLDHIFYTQSVAEIIEASLAEEEKHFTADNDFETEVHPEVKIRRAERALASVNELMGGNRNILLSEEFAAELPTIIEKYNADDRLKEIIELLRVVSDEALRLTGEDEGKVIAALAETGEYLIKNNHPELCEGISRTLLEWLRKGKGGTVLSSCCNFLQSMQNFYYINADFPRGDEILDELFVLKNDVKRKQVDRKIVEIAQESRADEDVFALLLNDCLAEPENSNRSRRLTMQGIKAADYIIESLLKSENKLDRLKMIDMVTSGVYDPASLLVAKLKEPLPWYGKRNLIKMLGDFGTEQHITIVYPYLLHDDHRVQHEAFTCLYKISGDQRRELLIKSINEGGETIKKEAIRALSGMPDESIIKPLGQVLKEYTYYSESNRDALLIEAVTALAKSNLTSARKVLIDFKTLRADRQARSIGERVWLITDEAISLLAENQQKKRRLQAQKVISERRSS